MPGLLPFIVNDELAENQVAKQDLILD